LSLPFRIDPGSPTPPRRVGILLSTALLLALTPALAQDAGLGGAWMPQGPAPAADGQSENAFPNNEISGAVHTVLAHPSNPDILYVGAVNGGIWRTMSGSAASPSWGTRTDGVPSGAIGAMEFDPTDAQHRTIWAGIGRFSSFGRLGRSRAGLLHSVNAGNSWKVVDGGGLLRGKNVSGIAPRGTTIVVSVNQADINTFGNIGVFRSTDGGATFSQVSFAPGSGLPGGIAFDLVSDPVDPARLYTTVVCAELVGGENGVYRSDDMGATWTKVSSPAIDALMTCSTTNAEMAVGPADNAYLAVANGGRLAGLFRSGDGGGSWAQLDTPVTLNNVGIHPGGQASIHMSILADPTADTIVYVGGDRQPFTLEEGLPFPPQFPNSIGAENFSGRLFRCDAALPLTSQCTPLTHIGTASNSSPHADSREMVFDAAGNIVQVDDGGVWRRTSPRDATGDWFSINGDLGVSEQHDASFDTLADIAFVGTQDNDDPHQNAPDDRSWFVLLSGDGGDTAVDAAFAPGTSLRYDSAQGLQAFVQTFWDADNNLLSFLFPALTVLGGGSPFVGQFVTPVEVNPTDGFRIVIGGANSVYESFDGGSTISEIGPGITINGNGVEPVAYGAVDNPDILYVGGGPGGNHFYVRTGPPPAPLVESLTFPGNTPADSIIRDIVIKPGDSATAFVNTLTRVFRTTDAGATWDNLTGDIQTFAPGALRASTYVPRTDSDVLVVSSFEAGVLYARESSGFTDWKRLGTKLPNVPVMDLHFDEENDVLVAGTLGRGAWKLQLE
jgi:hypothetical protein